jgi:hypothetical protein
MSSTAGGEGGAKGSWIISKSSPLMISDNQALRLPPFTAHILYLSGLRLLKKPGFYSKENRTWLHKMCRHLSQARVRS